MATSPTFSAGGLASGIEWNTIVDKLVQLESRPIALLQQRQQAVTAQISAIGELTSKLSALKSATGSLGTSGVLALKATSSTTSVAATAGTDAAAGRYAVRVESLASAAKSRSAGFAAGQTVTGGTLSLTVMGKPYEVTIADGARLEDVAYSINHAGAPVNAVILDDGTSRYLSITTTDLGFPIGGAPADALSIAETSTGAAGQPLGLAVFQQAANAVVHVDGLRYERTSNEVADAIPGTTLSLKNTSAVAEEVVIAHDQEATAAQVRKFVDAYNAAIGFVQKQLAVTEASDRTRTLAGDPSVRSLQVALKGVISAIAAPGGNVRTLADLGVKSERDGSLTLDATALAAAVARDARAVNEVFTSGTTGIAALVTELVDRHVKTDGVLTGRKNSLDGQLKAMDEQALRLQQRLEMFRTSLVKQFTAMENTVSGLKSMGNYLTQFSNQQSSGS